MDLDDFSQRVPGLSRISCGFVVELGSAVAVGLVIALAPLVTIWGAIAIVLGLLLLTAFLFGRKAYKRARHLAKVFLSEEERGEK